MNTKELGKIVNETCDKIKETLLSKGIEYSYEDDRLHNFNKGAEMLRCTSKQYLWALVSKHILALQEFIERDANRIGVTEEQWIEKENDIICYILLLKALRYDEVG